MYCGHLSFHCQNDNALQEGIIELSSKNVVILDEAGMTDNHSMLFVLDAIQKSGAKLCLVGEDAQLQPFCAGAIFRVLIEHLGFAELQTIYRQINSLRCSGIQDLQEAGV